MPLPPFHVAFGVKSIADTRAFYVDVLGCEEGRSSSTWIDFSMYGHQLSAHLCAGQGRPSTGLVDADHVPIPHMGTVLPWPLWEELAARVRFAGVEFLLAPKVRFAGEPGEQGTFFVRDPAGNALEFKALREPAELFADA